MSSRTTIAGVTVASKPVRALKGVILAACCAAVIVPFVGIVSTSLSTREQITRDGGFVLLPDQVSFAAYQAILSGGVVTRATLVSLFITIAGTTLSMATTILLAYGLSRPRSVAHRPVLMIVLFALLFTPGIIPSYLVVKNLGLLDTYWALILPVAVNAFNVIILRAFFMELPRELIESARIDGAGDVAILFRIILPLSKAVLAVIGLFYAVAYWNAFFSALLYLNDTAKWPLQLVLRTYVINQTQIGVDQLGAAGVALPPQEAIQMAILVLSIVPILVVYPFVQRHFTKGVLIGAVKG
ncbi:carbohydrate ABC transporter permease [Plantactinospora soyae]|uniref:Multiple sugar transport system permease protein/putative aldouronate transport system permease protein n=1 Tax=Plantactinospora soyae TaxID=1544732 RepID=A0A927MB82_9ACTN|nr:carbohydrate ABC transporter permease [Plantactinospora soyae]MBE1489971.1 multiple sugar transport system permease protein/putative aldouronate transport system permease protein [Plantactinospora soyae]